MTEIFKNAAYNLKYKAIGLLEEWNDANILGANETAYILGCKFNSNADNFKDVNQQILNKFTHIIWITYRSGFTQLPNQNNIYITDRGWGCMIRVGQMLFAQILTSYLNPQTSSEFAPILQFFHDSNQESIFSIQKIAKLGRKLFNLKPGDWYNPAQITNILEVLFSYYHPVECSNLAIKVFYNSNLFYDQIMQAMHIAQKQCLCIKSEDNLLCTECSKSINAVAIIILTRIGVNQAENKYLDTINLLMQLPYYRGIIGGKPHKALYFIGKHNNDYVYLDPHYVQKGELQIQKTYFCQSYRKCRRTSIDPSMGICFYLENGNQLNNFYKDINKIKKSTEQFFIYTQIDTPYYFQETKKRYTLDDDKQFQQI